MSGDVLTQRRRGAGSGVAMQVRLGDVCELNMGQSPESASYNTVTEGLPFYQGNADFGPIYPTPRVWCNSPVKIAEAGDLLVSVRAPIGALNFANERCCIGRGLAALRVKPDSDSKFIYYALKSNVTELNARGTGSTFKAINKKALSSLLFPLPPLAEQRRITAKLDRICDIVVKRKQQLVQLQQLVKSRFVEMFGNELEQGRWPSTTVGEVANVCVGVVIKPTQYYQESGIRAFRSLNIGEMVVKDDDWVFFSETGHAKNQKSVVHRNDVLVVRSGAPGTACVVPEHFDGCNAVDIIIARPDCNKVDPTFLAMFTNMPHGKNQIRNQIGGAAQQHYNVGGYKKLQLIAPPLPLQREFAAFVAKVDKLAFAARQRREVAKQLYRAKIQEFFG